MGPRIDTEWKTLPHGPLEQLAENVWRVEGDLPKMALKRCMVVARASNGDLVLHSAIAMNDEQMAALEALGRPAYLIVPNGWHCLDAARYKARYPQLKVICPRKAVKMVSAKVQGVDGDYDDFASLDDEGSVRLEHFDRDRSVEGALVARSSDGVTLVFGDSLFNLPHRKGLLWWLYGRLLGATGGPRVTPIGRVMMTLTRSKEPFREFLRRYADSGDVKRIVPGHGAPVTDDCSEVLRSVDRALS